jgi:uncharacterized protein YoxC
MTSLKNLEKSYNAVMIPLSTLDILIITSTIFIAIIGVYLTIILHRVAHMTQVADRVAHTVEKFQDLFSVIDRVPTDIIKRITNVLPKKKTR